MESLVAGGALRWLSVGVTFQWLCWSHGHVVHQTSKGRYAALAKLPLQLHGPEGPL